VRQVRALAGRSARRRARRFLVEGPQGVREAVRFAPESVLDVYVTAEASARHPEIAAEATDRGIRVHECAEDVAAAMSGDAQGVLAVVGMERAEGQVLPPEPRLVAILAEVRDPGNAGTVIRAADAAGADAVVFAGECVEAVNPKVLRASAGSYFHLPVIEGISLADAVSAVEAAGMRVLVADGRAPIELGSPGADADALAGPTAWVFGNEARGLTPEQRALGQTVRIPVYGKAESLNLAAAAAVCLYASASARRRG
jgi:TrmH family RNA methyltransferase